MYIKKLKSLFVQFDCGQCKRSFKQSVHLNDHIKTCDGTLVKHVWKGVVYKLKSSIKKCLDSFGIDTSKRDFLFPHLVAYDMEASLPPATTVPAAKWEKMCTDIHGNQVEQKLKLKSTYNVNKRPVV